MIKVRDISIIVVCLVVSSYFGWQLVNAVVIRNAVTKAELVICENKLEKTIAAYQQHFQTHVKEERGG